MIRRASHSGAASANRSDDTVHHTGQRDAQRRAAARDAVADHGEARADRPTQRADTSADAVPTHRDAWCRPAGVDGVHDSATAAPRAGEARAHSAADAVATRALGPTEAPEGPAQPERRAHPLSADGLGC